jgi:hypothetical protein
LDANVLPEPAGPVEIVEDIPGDSKILSERDLKFEMARQEVVSTDRHIRLRYPHGQPGHDKSAVCGNLLASPRLLYAKGGIKKGGWVIT